MRAVRMKKKEMVLPQKALGMWENEERLCMCEVTAVVGKGPISGSDRKCLRRWKSREHTLRTVYRKQPTLQLFVCIYTTAFD